MTGPTRTRISAFVLLALLALAPLRASAHGPSVNVSYSGFRPSVLGIATGTTVHFRNANASQLVCTVVTEDGSIESPALDRSAGWHHTFEKPGTYRFRIRERPDVTATIVVGDP